MYRNEIKLFSIDGEVKSPKYFATTRYNIERYLDAEMKDGGYLPVYDLGSGFFLEYDHEQDKYNFLITMYGIYVGKKEASKWAGLALGRMVPKVKTGK